MRLLLVTGLLALTLAARVARAQDLPKQEQATSRVMLRVDGGWSYRRMLDLPVTGADVGLGLGFAAHRTKPPNVDIWPTTRLFLGSTEHGLRVWTWRLGADFDIIFGRLRIGVGPNFFLIGVKRATTGDTINAAGLALHGGLRFDVFQDRTFAIFARADIDCGVEFASSSMYWGPTFGAGVDFDLVGQRAP